MPTSLTLEDKKAEKLRFVGYSMESKVLDDIALNIVVRRDVVFNEEDFSRTNRKNRLEENSVVVDAPSNAEERVQHTPTPDEHRYPVRERRKPPIRYGRDEFASLGTEIESSASVPKNLKEALESNLAKEWRAAADSEYLSLVENDTCDSVTLPPNKTAIGCKWVFKMKYGDEYGDDGSVARYKGRLVAKGYSQKYGVDYEETFAPVVRFSSIRALLAFAVQNDMLVHQMDVQTAFLNGTLEEEIFMQQPEGYIQDSGTLKDWVQQLLLNRRKRSSAHDFYYQLCTKNGV